MKVKRVLSLMLSASILASAIAGINVSAEETDGTGQGAEIIMDFSKDGASVPQGTTGTNFGGTYDASTAKTVTNATIDTAEKALKIDATNGENDSTDAYVSIPLTNADGTTANISTADGPFAITVTMKLPSSKANPPLRGFPILSDNNGITDVIATKGNTVFGLSHMGNFDLMTAANGTYNTAARDACWLRKGYGIVSDKQNDYCDKQDKKDTNQKDTTNLGDGNSNYNGTQFLKFSDSSNGAAEVYYDYKWIIDPVSETFKLWYKKTNDTEWKQAYGDKYMINPKETTGGATYDAMRIVRYNELGMMPTGKLPQTITNFKLRQMKAGNQKVDKSYYIKSIKVEQSEAVASEYKGTKSAGNNNMEFGTVNGEKVKVPDTYKFKGNGSATTGNGYLTYTSGKDDTGNNMPDAEGVTIPLDNPIVTRNGKFVIETKVKFGNPGDKVSRPIRSFPALTDGTNINAIGVSWGTNKTLQATANNNRDGLGLVKTWNSQQIDNANNVNNDAAAANQLNTVKDYTGASDIKIADMKDVYGKWYSYRLEIDPYSETYKFAYKNETDTEWQYPYADKYFANPNKSTADAAVYYEEPGIMPTGKLPSVITAMRLMENVYAKASSDYQHVIDYIKTEQDIDFKVIGARFKNGETIELKTNKAISGAALSNGVITVKDIDDNTIVADNYTLEINETGDSILVKFGRTYAQNMDDGTYTVVYNNLATVDGEKLSGRALASIKNHVEYSVSGTDADYVQKLTTGVKSGQSDLSLVQQDGAINWVNKKTDLNADSLTYLDFDFDDISVATERIEIEFTAKLPGNYYRLCGFPNLVDAAGKEYNFGFDTATPNNTSWAVEQYLFRNLGGKNMVKKGGDADNDVNLAITDHTTTQLAALGLTAPKKISYGTKDGAVVGASADFYDFKFVIDPIAKEYRYYQRKNGAGEYEETFAGIPGYPIAIDSMPQTVSKLRFYMGRNTANNSEYTGMVSFKNIAVRTMKKTSAEFLASRIINRTYALSDGSLAYADGANTTTNDKTQATINVKFVNYKDTAVGGTVILAVYKNGDLVKAGLNNDVSIQPGVSERTFTFDAPEATWTRTNESNQDWDSVTKDEQIYRVFLWTMDGLIPLANDSGI